MLSQLFESCKVEPYKLNVAFLVYCIYNGSIMNKSVINFKVDTEVKLQAQELARELGVPLSTVINAQLKQFLRMREFSVEATPRMTPELESILEQVENDRQVGRNFSPSFESIDDMFVHLKSS